MMELYEHRPRGFEIALHDTAKALLSAVELLLPIDKDASLPHPDFSIIKDVVDYINANYVNNITLEDLAGRFFFSPYYLARKFKDETGYTNIQYFYATFKKYTGCTPTEFKSLYERTK